MKTVDYKPRIVDNGTSLNSLESIVYFDIEFLIESELVMSEMPEHRNISFITAQCSMIASFAIALLFLGSQVVVAQEKLPGNDSGNHSARRIEALEKILKDFKDHLQKRERIIQQYKKTEETIKQNDADFQRINNEAMRQQLLAIQASVQSMRMDAMLSDIQSTSRLNEGLRAGSIDEDRAKAAIGEKAKAELDVAVRRMQLSQLDQAQQVTVRRRIECLETAISLQNEWQQWQQDFAKFLDRYWADSDPERRFSLDEIDAKLKVLLNADPDDFAATITTALLLERAGQQLKALSTLEPVLKVDSFYKSTALCTKALVLSSLGEEKEAKSALQAATKCANKSPYDRWIKARIAASQKQYSTAEREWKALIANKPMEFEARRALVLALFAKGGKNPLEKKRVLKEAQLAFDLEPTHDWYSHFVLALGHYTAGSVEEAVKEIESAEKLATDENVELCRRIHSEMTNNQLSQWNFLNTCQ
jgi:tetratricopeptide (TPR) repeat protein